MRLLSRNTLIRYAETQKTVPQYETLKSQVRAWCNEVEKAAWKNFAEIKKRYVTVSAVGKDRFVFNLVGNHYRVLVKINFDWQLVLVEFIGTHKEYDALGDLKKG